MLFNSIEFLIFLPIVFVFYWFIFNRNIRAQNLFLVIVSYIFYGWWDWRFLFLIAVTSFCSWESGILIERAGEDKKTAKRISTANIVLNLLILGIFKYYNFFVVSFAELFGANPDSLLLKIFLPVGISFYTFQALSYSIDVYRKKLNPTHDIIEFFAFVSFFPQLVAGPIERGTNLLPQFQKPRTFDYDMAVDGVRQMLWGFFKKIVVADNCAIVVNGIWADYASQSGSTLFLVAVLFAFQIYGDFSGYSDIAIGVSKLFGIKLMRNFNVPYFSRDIAEFWRRWHISLTTWFRDYVYIPLGGSRCSKARVIRNTFVIFLVSGFWHGANWTFIAWGGYHALLFLPLILLGKNRKYKEVVASDQFFPSIKELSQMLLTFVLVAAGLIIFRAESMGQVCEIFSKVLSPSFLTIPNFPKRAMVFVSILLTVEWVQRKQQHALDLGWIKSHMLKYACYLAILVSIFCFGVYNESFIYFQF